ncbi:MULTISPECIES: carbohydrate kinase [unclassified Colwellia]|uniref:carbohydrate kinase family protein n=1 Tax=unclassified Colwellia TaxID=196834 RepID=UPI0015F53F77|nr:MULTISPECIES: carbohydrate kinase [unclassified Colwellia]MBA6349708.1 carbohydrate kinase [Colwellia sp. BRX8-9]MBA6380406.1 carbohydrate kinase [Colwellia sp. BRX10-7]MBA6387804.1 carbohydrate kinase [Colwellia sp. BRX10-2]MBA6402773.1 carbohydrate kinase [Colwellia sp. BRX10-5]MBA6406858.1 carbohydrate kinase [Colwellia sp. BRX10-1]
MFSLISYGEVLVDFLPTSVNDPSYIPLAGGAPANVAVAYAKLGGAGYFAGGVSEDNFGNMLMQALENEGVNTDFVKRIAGANTALVLVSLDSCGERTFNFYRHNTADMQYGISQVDKINWQNMGFFHFCSNTLTSQPMYSDTLYAIKNAKRNNVLISFDVNLRQQLWQDLSLLMSRVEACIEESDIVKLSKDEAEYLAKIKQVDVDVYVQYLLLLGAKLIVITDGANPVQVTCASFSIILKVPKVSPVDTTGAGDSFISGFLFSLAKSVEDDESIDTLYEIIELREHVSAAVLFGANCGAFTCQKKGAFTALPHLTDI